MKDDIEKISTYLLVIGFFAVGTGIVISIIRSALPFEQTIIVIGIALIILGMLAAKIFGEVL